MRRNLKKIMSVLLAMIMIVSAVPMSGVIGADLFATTASAEELASTGQCGENVYWTFDVKTGLLTISGEGDMYDYSSTKSPFYQNSINTIIIEDGVTSISDSAFYSCRNLTEVKIGDTVENIGRASFFNASKLNEIMIPAGVTSIGKEAFFYCENLTSIVVDEKNIKYDSRNNCDALIDSDSNELIKGCKNTIIPDGVVSIGRNAFLKVHGLSDVAFPESVISIDYCAFQECTGLTSLKIPANVTSIHETAFLNCSSLTSIEIDDKNSNYDSRNNCNAIINTKYNQLLQGCYNTVIPVGVEIINRNAFAGFEKLTHVIIPDSVTGIRLSAFSGCRNLKDIYYTGSEDEWDSIAIQGGNDYLLNATIHYNYGKISGQCGDNVNWSYDETDKALLISGTGAMDSNASFDDYGWYSFKDEIEYVKVADGVTIVGTNAFSGCGNLKEVFLGDAVTVIGENAFADCTALAIVTVTSNSFSADNAFSGNSDKINFVVINVNKDAVKFSSDNSIPIVIFEIKDQTISFNNNILIYSDLEYNYLSEIVEKYSSAKEIYFKSLEFDGLKPDIIVIEDCENIDVSAQNFTLNDLYVIIQVLKNDESETVSFARMFELLESGDYDAFKIVINHGGEVIEKNIFQKIADFFEGISTNALRVIKRAVNFVASIFRKK